MTGYLAGKSFSALIVDDEEDFGAELVEAVELMGGHTTYFSCPCRCLTYLCKQRPFFDAVIADLAMPKMNGIDFLELAVKYIENTPELFIITGLAEFEGKELKDCENLTLLNKPLTLRDLREKIGRSLSKR
ncbi:response regulator [Rhodobacteraceae bacterium S2214]|nr:response regulator [Rhodobacteraceae bacterium S2214]